MIKREKMELIERERYAGREKEREKGVSEKTGSRKKY